MCWKVTDMFAASYRAITIKRAMRGFPISACLSGWQQAGCQASVGDGRPSSQWTCFLLMPIFFKILFSYCVKLKNLKLNQAASVIQLL